MVPQPVAKKNEQQFPRLAAVARQVLSVQPTSAPSERVFSASGTVFSKKRMSLTPDNADKLIFMHLNDAVLISDFIGLCKASYILFDSVFTIQIQYPCYLYVILLVVIYDKIEFYYLDY